MSDDESTISSASNPQAKLGTLKPTRGRNYCFTLNNPVKEDEDYIATLAKDAKYIVYGREKGASGTPHLQGQICFKLQKAFSSVKTLLGYRFHIEVTADLFASIKYCKKDGDFVEFGTKPDEPREKGQKEQLRWGEILAAAKQGDYDEIDPKVQVLHMKNLEHIHNRELRKAPLINTFEKNVWYQGATGTGKSRSARENHPGAFVKMLNKWWDGYENHEIVIIEDVDPATCDRMAHLFKVWTDHYPFPCEVKGSAIQIRPRRFVVTSNYSIEQCFPNRQDYEALYRRFEVYEFVKLGKPPVRLNPSTGTIVPAIFNPMSVNAVTPVALPTESQMPPPVLKRSTTFVEPSPLKRVAFVVDDSDDEEEDDVVCSSQQSTQELS